jgi:hypothetical protein
MNIIRKPTTYELSEVGSHSVTVLWQLVGGKWLICPPISPYSPHPHKKKNQNVIFTTQLLIKKGPKKSINSYEQA